MGAAPGPGRGRRRGTGPSYPSRGALGAARVPELPGQAWARGEFARGQLTQPAPKRHRGAPTALHPSTYLAPHFAEFPGPAVGVLQLCVCIGAEWTISLGSSPQPGSQGPSVPQINPLFLHPVEPGGSSGGTILQRPTLAARVHLLGLRWPWACSQVSRPGFTQVEEACAALTRSGLFLSLSPWKFQSTRLREAGARAIQISVLFFLLLVFL